MKLAVERRALNGLSYCVKCSARSIKDNCPFCFLPRQIFLSVEDLKISRSTLNGYAKHHYLTFL